jgi:hypothetical protein
MRHRTSALTLRTSTDKEQRKQNLARPAAMAPERAAPESCETWSARHGCFVANPGARDSAAPQRLPLKSSQGYERQPTVRCSSQATFVVWATSRQTRYVWQPGFRVPPPGI